MKKIIISILAIFIAMSCTNQNGIDKSPLAIQTDFGRKDNAVASMYGVALTVDKDLKVLPMIPSGGTVEDIILN